MKHQLKSSLERSLTECKENARQLESCRCNCRGRLPLAARELIHANYHVLSNSGKVVYLRGAVKPKKVERRRGHNTDCESPRAERRAFEYEVEANGVSYKICQNAFLAVLDINRSKLMLGGR